MGETTDLFIIGGGINGCGIARDAAGRGLSVVLAEMGDLGSGASGSTTKLAHGGIRYLAQGKIHLVYEASREKMTIQRIAPHLADPLCFTFPSYRGMKQWALWKLGIGVKLYDFLCGKRNTTSETARNIRVKCLALVAVPSVATALRMPIWASAMTSI